MNLDLRSVSYGDTLELEGGVIVQVGDAKPSREFIAFAPEGQHFDGYGTHSRLCYGARELREALEDLRDCAPGSDCDGECED